MDFGVNQGLVEELFLRYRENPRAVADNWRRFFEGLGENELAALTGGAALPAAAPTNGGPRGTLLGMPAPLAPRVNGNRPPVVEELIGTGPRPRVAPPSADAEAF